MAIIFSEGIFGEDFIQVHYGTLAPVTFDLYLKEKTKPNKTKKGKKIEL